MQSHCFETHSDGKLKQSTFRHDFECLKLREMFIKCTHTNLFFGPIKSSGTFEKSGYELSTMQHEECTVV